MSDYLKGGLKILLDYFLGLVFFVAFIVPMLDFKVLVPYSILIFLITFSFIYFDMKKQAMKDKKSNDKRIGFPLKGFVLGLIAMIPFGIIEILYVVIRTDESRAKHLALNTLLGPLYGFIKLCNEATAAYILVLLLLPIVAGFAYLIGYKEIDIMTFFNKRSKV